MSTNSSTPILLKKAEVCTRLSMSERTLEGKVNAGEFPPGRRIGKFIYWTEVAIQQWVVRYFGAQEAWMPSTVAARSARSHRALSKKAATPRKGAAAE
ncbi:putative DNA-binding transcriptional regulator AlpA [Pelomonas aquatica]|uniref:DNA-binding transcriptional regulator AlpA n=1 Tax=Pelomonas aquatica TaxID=431058 RepID=A0ABU1Z8Y0_9BURK|nr:helix-turn-helix domain-containing protein [Pelomonas aquatica]MDR7297057.1 putative DNA-binding transcriptional regulator AlpA [Pelomonas aquatica]